MEYAQILLILLIYNWLATKSDIKRVTLAHELKCRITCRLLAMHRDGHYKKSNKSYGIGND